MVDAVASRQDQVTISKNGAPTVVLVGADERESLQETLYWLSQAGIREFIAEADDDVAAGRTYGEDQIRTGFGVPCGNGRDRRRWLLTASQPWHEVTALDAGV